MCVTGCPPTYTGLWHGLLHDLYEEVLAELEDLLTLAVDLVTLAADLLSLAADLLTLAAAGMKIFDDREKKKPKKRRCVCIIKVCPLWGALLATVLRWQCLCLWRRGGARRARVG